MAGSLGKQRREAGCAETWLPEPGPAVVPLVAVFVTTAVRTSAGPGPGVRRAPPGEAAALVNGRRAVYGDQPPRGYSDGGTDTRGCREDDAQEAVNADQRPAVVRRRAR